MAISHFSLFIFSIFFISNFLITQSSDNIDNVKTQSSDNIDNVKTQSSDNIDNVKTALISETCNTVVGKNSNISLKFCLRSLHFATRYRLCNNLGRLGFFTIGLVRTDVFHMRHLIKMLMWNKIHDPSVRSCLADCWEVYSDAIPMARRAMFDYRIGLYEDANVEINGVMDAVETCENGFKEMNVQSPLKKKDVEAVELIAIVLEIMKMVQ